MFCLCCKQNPISAKMGNCSASNPCSTAFFGFFFPGCGFFAVSMEGSRYLCNLKLCVLSNRAAAPQQPGFIFPNKILSVQAQNHEHAAQLQRCYTLAV